MKKPAFKEYKIWFEVKWSMLPTIAATQRYIGLPSKVIQVFVNEINIFVAHWFLILPNQLTSLGYAQAADLLIKGGADVDAKDYNSQTPLQKATGHSMKHKTLTICDN